MITNYFRSQVRLWSPTKSVLLTDFKWHVWSGILIDIGLQITRGEQRTTVLTPSPGFHIPRRFDFQNRTRPIYKRIRFCSRIPQRPQKSEYSSVFDVCCVITLTIKSSRSPLMATQTSYAYRIHLHEQGPTSAEGIKRNLQLEEVPKPQAGSGQVLVRMEAAALNCG